MKEAISIPQYKGSIVRSQSLSKRPAQTYKEAAQIIWNGSYADGAADQSVRLPFAVMGSHVNLPSSDHSEMASDENRFASCFLALCAKALIKAEIKLDFDHNCGMNNCKLESCERLFKSTSSALSQNKRSICLSSGRRSINISLESAPIHTDQKSATKITISSGIANPAYSVRQTLSFPYKTLEPSGSVRQIPLFPYGIQGGGR